MGCCGDRRLVQTSNIRTSQEKIKDQYGKAQALAEAAKCMKSIGGRGEWRTLVSTKLLLTSEFSSRVTSVS